ncbi:MAG: TOBE domain-containing protein, partial [Rhizobiaceae bacterium]
LSLDLPHRGIAPGPAALAVRPHAVKLAAGSADGIEGRVTKAAYLGDHMEYTVATVAPEAELFATAADVNRPLSVGAAVSVHIDPESVGRVGDD